MKNFVLKSKFYFENWFIHIIESENSPSVFLQKNAL